jgi:hypothetical protein
MTQQFTHEHYDRVEHVAPGSERAFAIVIAAALSLFGALNWWHDGHAWAWLIGTAALLLILGFCWPAALKPLNWLWFKFGLLLHAVINPLVMGLVFYGAVLPTGLVMRALGKDSLRLKLEPDRDSYWLPRQPPGPAPETMKDQF